MKTYKLDGLEYYTVAFDKNDAALSFIINKIGVTSSDIVETDIEPNRAAIGRVFRSLTEFESFEIEY